MRLGGSKSFRPVCEAAEAWEGPGDDTAGAGEAFHNGNGGSEDSGADAAVTELADVSDVLSTAFPAIEEVGDGDGAVTVSGANASAATAGRPPFGFWELSATGC
jgi:hypothetical protein